MKKRLILALAAVLLAGAASAQTPEYDRALDLYGHGMYAEAAQLLERIPGSEAEGYAALCAIELQAPGYEKRAEAFLDRWPESPLVPQVNFRWAQDLFDRGLYREASYRFSCVTQDELMPGQVAEYAYKKGYSAFGSGDLALSRMLLEKMQNLPPNFKSFEAVRQISSKLQAVSCLAICSFVFSLTMPAFSFLYGGFMVTRSNLPNSTLP